MRKSQALRSFDPDISVALMDAMGSQGIELHTNTTPQSLQKAADGSIEIATNNGTLQGYDCVIWAIGRTPELSALNLPAAGLQANERGFITVDEFQRTDVPGIYCIGDACGGPQLTPVAIAQGRRLADRVFDGQKGRHLPHDNIATVVFTHPVIGTVGLSEPEAVQQYGAEQVKCYRASFKPMAQVFNDNAPKTVMKLVTVGPDERVIGCHVIGDGADEMLQGVCRGDAYGRAQARL